MTCKILLVVFVSCFILSCTNSNTKSYYEYSEDESSYNKKIDDGDFEDSEFTSNDAYYDESEDCQSEEYDDTYDDDYSGMVGDSYINATTRNGKTYATGVDANGNTGVMYDDANGDTYMRITDANGNSTTMQTIGDRVIITDGNGNTYSY